MINQQELAETLELSQAAVSKALRGSLDISEETRDRVQQTARRLGYIPNRLARSMASGRTGIVGMLTHRYGGAHFVRLQLSLFEELSKRHHAPLITQAGLTPEERARAVALLHEYRIEGLIVLPGQPGWAPPQLLQLIHGGLPVVCIGDDPLPGACNVIPDEKPAATELVCHLLALGHRRIAHWGDRNPTLPQSLRERDRGYLAALAEAGAQGSPDLEIPPGPGGNRPALEEIARTYMQAHPDVTAVFVDVDDSALAVIAALRRLGRRVPEDVSVTGFGDNIQYPDDLAVPLTTVSHQPERLAREAIELLDRLVAGENLRGDHRLPCRVIHRASVAPPPATVHSRPREKARRSRLPALRTAGVGLSRRMVSP